MNHLYFIEKVKSLHPQIGEPWIAEGHPKEATGCLGLDWKFKDKHLIIVFLPEGKIDFWCQGPNFEREDFLDDEISILNSIAEWFAFGERF